ncbi:MAG TPA: cysteine desulfurase family protein, partial [Stellaceae bacterium]|nr:cysteine desulfurase family protein [Stellaceae bacterium]
RAQVASLVGAAPSEVVFTSGGTEANHLALRGVTDRRILISAIEHDSVRAAAPEATVIPVTSEGVVDLRELEAMLAADARPALVSIMLANNETGAIQPIAEIAAIARAHGALLHCDAIQGAGKIPVTMRALGADLMSISAHKLGGPQGVGALVVREGVTLGALQRGGGQERGRRAGTENLPGIVGLGAAAEVAAREGLPSAAIAELRDAAQAALTSVAPEARVFAKDAPRLPNTLCIGMPGVAASTQVMALDLAGVMVSAGAACSSGKVRRSHVLAAMGATPEDAESAIRVSLGWSTTAADIERLIDAWTALYRRTRSAAA